MHHTVHQIAASIIHTISICSAACQHHQQLCHLYCCHSQVNQLVFAFTINLITYAKATRNLLMHIMPRHQGVCGYTVYVKTSKSLLIHLQNCSCCWYVHSAQAQTYFLMHSLLMPNKTATTAFH